MPSNPFDKPSEIKARAQRGAAAARDNAIQEWSGGLLSGLNKPAKKPAQKHGFIVTEEDDAEIRRGGTPPGFTRDKDGRLRAMVQ